MMLAYIHEFWKAGLLAIHPETLRVRCFVPSDILRIYDDKVASFPQSDIPDRDSLRLHYEKCVWVNMTAHLPRIALELPSAAQNESPLHRTVEVSIAKAQATGVADATCQEYCTQSCLLGLMHGGLLDEECPNYARHSGSGRLKNLSHPLDHESFSLIIQKQLEIDQVLFCQQPTVAVKGHHSEFFKITLTGFGYTFCAKGMAVDNQHRLMNEYILYQHMNDLQGMCVPVSLGLFALQCPFGSQSISGQEITHMFLMSHAGACLEGSDLTSEACNMPSEETMKIESDRTMDEIRSTGVDRQDQRRKHLYWNAERQRVFYIDFEKNPLSNQIIVDFADDFDGNQREERSETDTEG